MRGDGWVAPSWKGHPSAPVPLSSINQADEADEVTVIFCAPVKTIVYAHIGPEVQMVVSLTVKNVSALLYELSTDVDPERDLQGPSVITADDMRIAIRVLGYLIAQPNAACFATDLLAEMDTGSHEQNRHVYQIINRFAGVFCSSGLGRYAINIATAQNDELT